MRLLLVLLIGSIGHWVVSMDHRLPAASFQKTRKRALMIVINQFKSKGESISQTGYPALYTTNDSTLMYRFLANQGFDQITVLYNQQATVQAVKQQLSEFARTTSRGDINVVYISSHGYHVPALRPKSEKDGQDEVVICYDSPSVPLLDQHYQKNKVAARQNDMLVDDELGENFDILTRRMGKEGHLLFLLDACSSNTGTRNGNSSLIKSPLTKAGPESSELDEEFDLSAELQDGQEPQGLVALFAAKEGGAAFVFKDAKISAMTYGFLKAIQRVHHLSPAANYTQLAAWMKEEINAIIEQNYFSISTHSFPKSTLCLGGNELTQRSPVLLGRLSKRQVIIAHPQDEGGYQVKGETVTIQTDDFGVTIGSRYEFRANDVTVATGIVVALRGNLIDIKLTSSRVSQQVDWDRLDPVLTERNLNVLSMSIWVAKFADQKYRKKLVERLQQEKLIRLVSDEQDAQVRLLQRGNKLIGFDCLSGTELVTVPSQEDQVLTALRNLALYRLFSKLSETPAAPQIQLTLVPALINVYCQGKLIDKKDKQCSVNRTFMIDQTFKGDYFHHRFGKPAVDTSMQVVLSIRNLTKQQLYFQVLDVDPAKQMTPLFPTYDDPCQSGACNVLEAGGVYSVLIPDFYPPFGLEEFQVISSQRPIDIRSFLNEVQGLPKSAQRVGKKSTNQAEGLTGSLASLTYYIIPNEEKNTRPGSK